MAKPFPSDIPDDVKARFWAKADVRGPNECWLWPRGGPRSRYGKFGFNGDSFCAHRVAYELAVGPIPDGLTIDHLCRETFCVNPQHLEAVTQQENNRRSTGFCGTNIQKTHCPYGHPYSTYKSGRSAGHRYCRTCLESRRGKVWP